MNLSWLLRNSVYKSSIAADDIFENKGTFNHFQFNRHFSKTKPEHCIDTVNAALSLAGNTLSTADLLVLTLGTANGYIFKETGEMVGNCHKVPGKYFEKVMSDTHEITYALKCIIDELLQVNPQLKILLTVSPVRHTKDGLIQNQRSKARLIESAHLLEESYPFIVHYFPSYEIMMDDLRDYRFYERDMIHPSQVAVEYIWELFAKAVFEESVIQTNTKIDQIQKSLSHRPINIKSLQHITFLQSLLVEIENLQSIEPNLVFTQEIQLINSQLNEA